MRAPAAAAAPLPPHAALAHEGLSRRTHAAHSLRAFPDAKHAAAHTRTQAFVQHYYTTFDSVATRPSLAALYQPQSMLTFEDTKLMARLRAAHAGVRFSACVRRCACAVDAVRLLPRRMGQLAAGCRLGSARA
jgi:hypothetical protein